MEISVVVPCYNCENTIEDCLRSLVSQKFRPVEIIMINDGSTDRSKEIAEKFPTVKVIDHVINQGLSSARNTGLISTKGEVIAFFDSDVVVPENYLEILNEDFESNPDVSGVGGGEIPAFTSTKLDKFRSTYHRQHRGDEVVYGTATLIGLAMAYKRKSLEKVGGFNDEFRTNGEDVFIGLVLTRSGYNLMYDSRLTVMHFKHVPNVHDILNLVYRNSYFGTKAQIKSGEVRTGLDKTKQALYEIKTITKFKKKMEFPFLRMVCRFTRMYATFRSLIDNDYGPDELKST